MPRSIVEDEGKVREDAAGKSRAETNKDKPKSVAVEDNVKVNMSQALLAFCNNIVTLLKLKLYII